MPDSPATPLPPLVSPTKHEVLAHLWNGVKAVARAIRKGVVFLYDGVLHNLGPAVGSEFNKLHVQDLVRSLLTSFHFTSLAAALAFAVNYFIPLFEMLFHLAAPGTVTLGTVLGTLLVDLLRRFGQVDPAPASPVAPTPTSNQLDTVAGLVAVARSDARDDLYRASRP